MDMLNIDVQDRAFLIQFLGLSPDRADEIVEALSLEAIRLATRTDNEIGSMAFRQEMSRLLRDQVDQVRALIQKKEFRVESFVSTMAYRNLTRPVVRVPMVRHERDSERVRQLKRAARREEDSCCSDCEG